MLTGLITINSFTVLSQNTGNSFQGTRYADDSLYQLNLRLFINEYHFLDSAYTSALKEIHISDSALTVQDVRIKDLQQTNFRQEEITRVLRQKLAEVESSGLKWYHYAGGSTLILVIGILTGLLIK